MSDLTLRPYQVQQFEAIRTRYRLGDKRTLISSPTGTGKTIVIVFVANSALLKGNRVLVLENTDELVSQTVEKFSRVGAIAGIVKQRKNEWDEQIVVGSVATLCRPNRLTQIPPDYFRMVVVDECHFANAESYQRILKHFSAAYMLGVSATLFRGDRQSLAKAGWESVAHVYTIEQAIADRWLVAPIAYKITTDCVVDKVEARVDSLGHKDFNTKQLSNTVNTVSRNATIVDAWLRRCEGRKTIAFCVDVLHAHDLANAFRLRGIDARAIYGDMPLEERRAIVAAHRRGEFPILTNCAVLTHGYDDSAVGAILMARPTQSKTLFVQCVGRGLRLHPEANKQNCLVLDFVDLSSKHRLVTTNDVIKLQRELEQGVPEAIPVGVLGAQVGEGKVGAEREQRFSNEDEAEAWKAKKVEMLHEKALEAERLKATPATDAQRKFLYMKLVQEFGWPFDVSRKVAWDQKLTRGDVPKIIGRAKYGHLKPEQFQ